MPILYPTSQDEPQTETAPEPQPQPQQAPPRARPASAGALAPRQRRGEYRPFDLAYGDSIAWMQVNHGIGGGKAPKFDKDHRGDFATGETAQIGAPPSEVLARLKHTLEENPEFFKGKRLFLSPGTSNAPGELNAVREILDTFKGLKENGPASIVVPGVGPGVPGSQAVNKALQGLVEGSGYKYYDPTGLRWNKDNIHPANAIEMGTAAGQVIGAPPPAPTTAAPAPNQLAPPGAPTELRPPSMIPGGTTTPPPTAAAAPPPSAGGVDPDAGLTLPDGTPVSVAKRMLRMFEPGGAGYTAAYGTKTGLPAGFQTGPYGFPQWSGNPVGATMYGGRFGGQLSHAAGMYQYQPGTWNPIAKELGITDFSPESQEKVTTAIMQRRGLADWLPWNQKFRAAYENYRRTGQIPNLPEPAGMYGGGQGPREQPAAGTLGRPDTGPISDVGGPSGGPAGNREFKPPEEMSGMQMLALAAMMATPRPIPPSTYDPKRALPQFDTSMPHSALDYSPVGRLTRDLGPPVRVPPLPEPGGPVGRDPVYRLMSVGSKSFA